MATTPARGLEYVSVSPRAPTFLVVGAQKAGTTALYEYLRRRPDVFMSPVKEPVFFPRDFDVRHFVPEVRRHVPIRTYDIKRYFENPRRPMRFCLVPDWDTYLRLFVGAGNAAAIGEACTWNLPSRAAAAEIRLRLPDARIVMVLRNPIDRAYSAYLMFWRWGRTRDSFRRAVEREVSEGAEFGRSNGLVHFSRYSDAVKRYFDVHPPDRIRVYCYEELRHNPADVLRDLLAFVGARSDGPLNVSGEFNRATFPRIPVLHRALATLQFRVSTPRLIPSGRGLLGRLYWSRRMPPPPSPADRAFLRSVFADDIDALSSLLRRDLTAWLD